MLLLAVIRWRRLALPRDTALWRRFAIQACLNSVVPFTLIAWAEQTVDAGLATVLNATSPIFAFFLTAALARHEAATGRKLFGVAAGLAGICLIVGASAFDGLGRALASQLAIVAATVCYAGAAIFGRAFKSLDPIMPAAGSLICGALVLVPLSLAVDRPWTLAPTRDAILALLGLSVFSTALALVIYFRLVNTIGSIGTTAQAYLRVPIGGRDQRRLSRREPDDHRLGGPHRRDRRRRGDDAARAPAGPGRLKVAAFPDAGTITALGA